MDNQTNISSQEKMISLSAGSALVALGAGLLLKQRVAPALGALAAGGALLYRGKMRHCAVYEALGINTAPEGASANAPQDAKMQTEPVKLTHSVTVNKPASEIYAFWSEAENFSQFMPQITSVEKTNGTRLKWTAEAIGGKTLHWESEIVADQPNELLRWETTNADSLANAALPHSGQLTLKELAHDRGTEVKLEITYDPQAGVLGAALATLFKAVPSQFALESLRRFKQLMEAGEISQIQKN